MGDECETALDRNSLRIRNEYPILISVEGSQVTMTTMTARQELQQLIDDELIDRPTAFQVAPNKGRVNQVTELYER